MLVELHERQKDHTGLSMSVEEALLLIATLSDQISRVLRHKMDSWEQTTCPIREFHKKYDWKDHPGVLVTHVKTEK